MPYLNCPSCRLTVYAPTRFGLREECPRCAARLGRVSRLFQTDLPQRLMEQLEGSVCGEQRSGTPGA